MKEKDLFNSSCQNRRCRNVQRGFPVLLALAVLLSLVLVPASGVQAGKMVVELWIGQTTIQVNGQAQAIDAAPFILEGRTMVPVRFVSEGLGATVEWFAGERKVQVILGGRVVDLWIDQKKALVDGLQVQLDVPPIIDDFRAFVPLRFLGEALGSKVEWDPETRKVTLSVSDAPLGSVWSLFHRDLQRSGRSPFPGPAQAVFRWQFSSGEAIDSSPVLAQDGTIYIGSSDGNLYALSSDGTKRWEFATGGAIHATPAIGGSGTIYLPSSDGLLYAISPSGSEVWRYPIEAGLSSP
ncbi:MAG: stalk domain-containing protein, partial [bacterium]